MLFGFFLTAWRSRPERGLRSFQNSFAQKAGALGILAATFLGGLFYHRQLDVGFCRCDELVLSAVAGNSHSDSRASTSKGKTASTEKPSVFGHVSGASEITREIEDEGFRPRQRRGLGLGGLPPIFPTCFTGRKIEPRRPFA